MNLQVKYNHEEDEYYIKQIHNGQTYYLAFQEGESEDGCIAYYNVYASVYSKRKHRDSNEYNCRSTGRDMFYSYSFFKKAFRLLEQEGIENFYFNYDYDKLIIECGWSDIRRRDVYHKVLSKWGYTYQRDETGKKILAKHISREEARKVVFRTYE